VRPATGVKGLAFKRLLASPIRSTLRSTVGGTDRFPLFQPSVPFATHHFASPIILIDRATP
jgi:hypothetical protein